MKIKHATLADIEATLFPVDSRPVPYVSDLPKPTKDSKHYANFNTPTGYQLIVNEKEGEVISCMTNDYKLITNQLVFETADNYAKKLGGVCSEANLLREGAVAKYKWIFPDYPVDIGDDDPDDTLFPTVDVINSYDGSNELTAIAGHWRLICTNGAIIGVIVEKGKTRHLKSMLNVGKLEDSIKGTVDAVVKHFGKFANHLKNTKFKPVEHIPRVANFFPEHESDFMIQKILMDKPKTWWDLYNVATNVFTHHSKRNQDSVRKRENRVFKDVLKMSGYKINESEVFLA